MVIVFVVLDKWMDLERGIEFGGFKVFGFGYFEYKLVGMFVKFVSVIDEFNVFG